MKDNPNVPNEQQKKQSQQPGDNQKKKIDPTDKSRSDTPEDNSSSDENDGNEKSNENREFRENDQSKKLKRPEAGDDKRGSL